MFYLVMERMIDSNITACFTVDTIHLTVEGIAVIIVVFDALEVDECMNHLVKESLNEIFAGSKVE